MTAVLPATTARTVPVVAYHRAQLRVWVRLRTGWILGVAAVFMVATTGLQLTTGRHTWSDAEGFLNLWVVAAGPLFTAVNAAWLAHRERACRSGGIPMRAIPTRHIVAGRAVVLATWTLLMQTVAIGTWAVLAGALSVDAHIGRVVGDSVILVAASWVSALWFVAALAAVGAIVPVAGPVVVGVATIVTGVVTAERVGWWMSPPAWTMRSVLGRIGTNVNGTSTQGDPLPAGPVPVVGSLLLAVVICVAAAGLGRMAAAGGVGGRGVSRPSVLRWVAHRIGGPTGAVLLVVRGTGVGALALAGVLVVAMIPRWRPVEDAADVMGLLILPLGATIATVAMTTRFRVAARALATRAPDPAVLGVRLVVVIDLVVAAVSVAAGAVCLAAGVAAGPVWVAVGVWTCVGWFLVGITAWCVVTAGAGVAAAVGITGTVFGALIGGTDLYGSVGAVVPWAWAGHPAGSAGWVVPAALIGAIVTSVPATRRVCPGRRV